MCTDCCSVPMYLCVYSDSHIVSNVNSTQCPVADKVALCSMLALCRVLEPHIQQSCLSFPAECQSPTPYPPLGGVKKKSKMPEHLLKLKENM